MLSVWITLGEPSSIQPPGFETWLGTRLTQGGFRTCGWVFLEPGASELGSLGYLPSISLTPEPQKLCDNLWVVLAPPHQTLGIVREDVVVL